MTIMEMGADHADKAFFFFSVTQKLPSQHPASVHADHIRDRPHIQQGIQQRHSYPAQFHSELPHQQYIDLSG